MRESKRRAIIFLSLSFLLALAAGFLVINKINEMNEQLGQMVDIYVANTDIASRSPISPEQVKARQIPKKFVDNSYITDKAALQGQVTVVPLSEGDIITKNMIKPTAQLREENNRLVTVYASDRIIFDQQLEALDRVDIIVSYEVNDQPVTEVFMVDVPVAMVSKTDTEFKGAALELPFDKVTAFIHQQHYVSTMRILKANVGKGAPAIPEPFRTRPREPGATISDPANRALMGQQNQQPLAIPQPEATQP
ncbi:flagella basal body P-ring formation protein FlgA [Brevibacillus composti]|uniref:Flagella basal body P-ring formation protein FlgA n=1 Tax=Brevibacillus composti TaxID=2796470 RepID=A0A7T5JQ46_9BACL|nr:SAF domain-containing protein [Brevibacillus composti]QQE75765.1 flagella basal body P-ring formation protein FlgA [Brevibacillus composti]QUO42791.1 flagella basal body P-ring formation protein FlgA [Brevibacillus composti]